MKTNIKQYAVWLAIIALVTSITGCKEKIDLNNIDTRIQAQMGLALPIGNMLFTTNDFLGNRQIKNIGVDANGIFHLMDTVKLANAAFPMPNISPYVDSINDEFKLRNKLENIEIPGYPPFSVLDEDGNLLQIMKGYSIPIRFTKTVKLSKINKKGVDKIRLDKAEVKSAQFTTVVTTKDMDDLLWDYIDTVSITFNKQFEMNSGNNTVNVYTKGDPKGGYGNVMPIDINNFVLNLMKQSGETPSWDNVVDTIELTFTFRFTVPTTQSLHISDESAFVYHFKSKKIDYSAIYGWLDSEETVHTRQVVAIDSLLAGTSKIDSLVLNIAEPSIHIGIAHHMSMPAKIQIDTLMTKNATQQAWATWQGSRKTTYNLYNVISPYNPNRTDSAWNYIRMNQDADSGHLDNLFTFSPDSLVLAFNVRNDASTESYTDPQHRITDQTRISSYAAVDVPFKFNSGSRMALTNKMVKVDFNKISIDSLWKEVKAVEQGSVNSVKMAMQFTNSLPFKIEATMRFLRKDSSEMNLNLLAGQELNRLTLPAPTMIPGNPYGRVDEPSISTYILDVSKQQLDSLVNSAQYMAFDFFMGENPQPCIISNTASIKVAVGLAASVEAIMNPKKK